MKFKNWFVRTSAAFLGIFGWATTFGCTSFELTSQDHTVLMTRTMEFAMDLNSNVRTYPRGHFFDMTTASGKPGLSWTSKYGYLYLDNFGVNTPIEGMNEAGLSFEGLLFPTKDMQYQTAPPFANKHNLPYIHLGDWILGNFDSVDQLKKVLNHVYVTAVLVPQFGTTVFPIHFFVHDASGKGIVIEYVNGKLNIYDDAVGVLTNAPSYDWQIKNVANYINLSPYTAQPIVIGKMVFESSGQGSGMRGVPGDISPPSRFIKILALKTTALPTQNITDTLNLAQHIINNVDIPLGYVRAKQANAPDANELTQWVVFEDLTHKVFYYRTYTDLALHKIDLNKINFAAHAPMLKMPLNPDNAVVVDNTATLMQSSTQ
jgi:choloylglycine hydrolase